MIADIFHPIFTLITILVCFIRKKKQNCLGDLHHRFHQGITPDPMGGRGAYSSPQTPSFNRFWLCLELMHLYFFCVIPWTSPDAFFIFSKFWFSGLLGGIRTNNGPKWQSFVCLTLYLCAPPSSHVCDFI